MFKPVPNQVDFVAQEHEVLDFWQRSGAFRQLERQNKGKNKFSFIDGPITANNPMGVHHAWGRAYKDLFQRYRAMRGCDQRWQNGFDCQGLWVEVEVEKERGFKSKRDIERFGLAEFVNLCKQRVLEYSAVQTVQSIRLGYWMDWNDPVFLRELKARMAEDPGQVITVEGRQGPVTDTVEMIVGRLGLPELGGSYFTFSNENNYNIWTALSRCHHNGWIYKGTDVMPWCARCGTGISQHEIVTEGYQELTHPSIFLRFPLRQRPGESLLVWTTTPWTLTSNVAAAVHPDLPYVLVDALRRDQRLWLSKGAVENAVRGPYTILDEKPGAALEGWTYDGPFDELPAQQTSGAVAAHRVILWSEVGETEGTGIVHIAPGCGAEDYVLGRQYGLPALAPLTEGGLFVEGFDWLTGTAVQDSAAPIFDDLERKGLVYRLQDYTHRYPVCWRCQQELVFRLVDEWFISMGEPLDKPYEQVTAEEKASRLRYQIMDAVQETRWIPDFGYEREMDWLRNMHDWMISKKRYWGLALPIWECARCGWFDVVSSEVELKARAIAGWSEFEGRPPHRPYVDAVKIRCEQCGAEVSRIADVGNPWLDAGIVAYSTLGYRTDREYWEAWFPADLITESFPGQFRNWFYSMLAMSTIMEKRAPFRTVQTYATLFAEDGRPMHKSWGNAIEFNDAADTMGVDVMRWMYCAHKPENNLLFGYHHADEVRRRFLIPLWNVYSFFVTYANLDGWQPAGPDAPGANLQPLDRWIVARLNQVVAQVTEAMEGYDPYTATLAVEPLLDDLSNWYVRRSRRRFWKSEHDADKQAAYATLYHVLLTLAKLLAPMIPFVTEVMYQNLAGSVDENACQSVHHCAWPEAVGRESAVDQTLLEQMALAMQVAALGRSARSTSNVKLRQPLARALVYVGQGSGSLPPSLAELATDELNVKKLEFVAQEADLVRYEIGLLPNVLGKKHGRRFPLLRQAVANGDAASLARRFQAGQTVSVELGDGGPAVELLPEEVEVRIHGREGYAVAEERGVVVAVDVQITPELAREGLVRDLVRRIQAMRKDAGFELDDRIVTYYAAGDVLEVAIQEWAGYIKAETLSLDLVPGALPDDVARQESLKLDGQPVTLGVRKA